ncbi:MAG: hypothetical protein KIS86_04710 [Devosia sp.]|nr:hypothetical protein [Devosia sp.]
MTTPIPPEGYQIPPHNPSGRAWWQATLNNLNGRLVDIKAEIAVTLEGLGENATTTVIAYV